MKNLFAHHPSSILTLDRFRLAATRNRSTAQRAEADGMDDVFISGPDVRLRREFLFAR